MIPTARRRRSFALMLGAVVTAACSGTTEHVRGPVMEPGRYSFDGSAQVTHYLQNYQRNEAVNISGVMDVDENGDVSIMSSAGSCSRRGSGVPPARLSLRCGRMNLSIGPADGTVRLQTTQTVAQRSGCDEFVRDAQGRPTGQCARHRWEERQRPVVISIPLAVVRTSGR